MSLETDLQSAISSATQLNQTVQGKIDSINSTLTSAVANVDSILDAATAQASSAAATVLAGATGKRLHIQSMYIPETTIVIGAAGMVGAAYDQTGADEPDADIIAANPHDHVNGFPMLQQAMVVNPAQEYCETYTASPTQAYSPYTGGDSVAGTPCFVDLPMWNHGSNLGRVNYANANKVWGDSTSGKHSYLVMRIGVFGSPHRAHRTWVSTNARHEGAHNGNMWTGVASPTIEEQQRFYINGTIRAQLALTEVAGPNAAAGSFAANNGIYLAEASGYGFGTGMASHYGSWVAIPIFGHHQWPSIRLWNWGFGELAISAVGIAYGDYMPDTPA